MEVLKRLEDVQYVRNFQEFCGVSYRNDEHGLYHTRENNTGTSTGENKGVCRKNQNKRILQTNDNNNLMKCDKPTPSCARTDGQTYVIKYKCIYYLAKVAAFLGAEEFYLIFFPFWLWNIDSVVGRRTFLVWCLAMYLGQATKDYLRWPRPLAPPVVRLESTYAQEYSMPSTHAMASTAIPLSLFVFLHERYEFPLHWAAIISVTWLTLVCLSRLYLGVHTILDLLCGIVFSALTVLVFLPWVNQLDQFQQTHPLAPVILVGVGIALSTVCYPCKGNHGNTVAKGDAVQIVAVAMGVGFGFWLNFMLGLSSSKGEGQLPYTMTEPSFKWFGVSILRFVSGAVIGGVVLEGVKTVTIRAASAILGLDKPTKTNPSVQTAYKFVSYFILGATVLCVIPYLHKLAGINRVEFYYETH